MTAAAADRWRVSPTGARCGVAPSSRAPDASAGRVAGSATVELVFIVPLVLMTLAFVWDLRAYIGYRTELSRGMYVVAEAIADDPTGAAPFAAAIRHAMERLRRDSASGSIRAAVIVRGTERADGTPCPEDEWCPPMVTVAWPVGDDTAGTWAEGDAAACAGGDALPAQGDHFKAGERVLSNEGVDPDGDGPEAAPGEAEWVSRHIGATQWWVVVDTCFHPQPGVFIGRLASLAESMLDTSFALRRRVAWGSVHDRADCDWCEP